MFIPSEESSLKLLKKVIKISDKKYFQEEVRTFLVHVSQDFQHSNREPQYHWLVYCWRIKFRAGQQVNLREGIAKRKLQGMEQDLCPQSVYIPSNLDLTLNCPCSGQIFYMIQQKATVGRLKELNRDGCHYSLWGILTVGNTKFGVWISLRFGKHIGLHIESMG